MRELSVSHFTWSLIMSYHNDDLRFDVDDHDLELRYDDGLDYEDEFDDFDDFEDDYDGQPDEYTEWQDLYGGDDWDHGQYDNEW